MIVNRVLCAAVFLSAGAFLLYPGIAAARQTIVIGSLGIGYDYWERDYDEDGTGTLLLDPDAGDRKQWGAWPEIEVQHNGIHDTLSLRYAPVIRYDELDETTDVDHYLTLEAERFFTSKWRVLLSDKYVMSSDPTRYSTPFARTGTEAPDAEQPVQTEELTQNLGRIRYWTNSLHVETSFAYAEDSDVGFGYEFRVLRNDTDDDLRGAYDEYDRHDFFGSLSRRFSPAWRSEVELRYIKGLYDDRLPGFSPQLTPREELVPVSQDLEEYRADVRLDHNRDARNTFPLLYRFREVRYEDFRRDILVHELAAGWDHSFDSRTSMEIGAGPSYVDAEDLDGAWGVNAYLDFTRLYQHGAFGASLSKGFVPRSFTGSNDSGLTDVTEARLDLTYSFTQAISSSCYGAYRYEEIMNPQGDYYLAALGGRDPLTEQDVDDVTYTRDSYLAGVSLDYGFWRWFVASLGYEYYRQDGDVIRDSYDDHRITFLISVSKELWRR